MPETMEDHGEERTRPGTAARMLPVACFLGTIVIALHFPVVTSALVGDYSRYPLEGWEARYGMLSEMTLALPWLIMWGGVWALFGWWVGARLWSILLALSTLGWLIVLRNSTDWKLTIALMLVTGFGSAGVGAVAGRRAGAIPSVARSAVAGGVVAVIGAFVFSLGAISACGNRTDPSTNFVFLAVIWLFAQPFLLVPAWLIGYTFPRVWAGTLNLRRSLVLLPIVLLPAVAAGIAFRAVNCAASKAETFRRDVMPQFLSYVDREIVRFPTSETVRIKVVGADQAEVSHGWYDYENMDADKLYRDLKVRVALDWSPADGLRSPTFFERSTVELARDPNDDGKIEQPMPLLRNRAALDRYLTRLGAREAMMHANWHPGPKEKWQDPRIDGYCPKTLLWCAECDIGGGVLELRILEDGRLNIEQRGR